MLNVQKISHSFGERKVLDDISFECAPREIVVVMGSSGGGKTTLLKCIAGLIKPTSGDILVDGVNVAQNVEKIRAQIGLVFQYAALFDSLTVAENVIFGLSRVKHMSAAEKAKVVKQLLADVGLEGIEKQLPDELSGGMRKRVGLARALAMTPSVLLYDEPTSGLDPITAYAIDQLIVETRDRTGLTSLVVSHDVTSIMRVADRIAFLNAGKLEFWGTPAEFQLSEIDSVKDLVEKSQAKTLARRA